MKNKNKSSQANEQSDCKNTEQSSNPEHSEQQEKKTISIGIPMSLNEFQEKKKAAQISSEDEEILTSSDDEEEE